MREQSLKFEFMAVLLMLFNPNDKVLLIQYCLMSSRPCPTAWTKGLNETL